MDIDLGPLEHGPHADLIRGMASKCAADGSVQAIWVGGSLAAVIGASLSSRLSPKRASVRPWISSA